MEKENYYRGQDSSVQRTLDNRRNHIVGENLKNQYQRTKSVEEIIKGK